MFQPLVSIRSIALLAFIGCSAALPTINTGDPLSSVFFPGVAPTGPILQTPGRRQWDLTPNTKRSADSVFEGNLARRDADFPLSSRSDGNMLIVGIHANGTAPGLVLGVSEQTCASTPIASYLGTDLVTRDVNWGDVVNDLKAVTLGKYVLSLRKGIQAMVTQYEDKSKAFFGTQSSTPLKRDDQAALQYVLPDIGMTMFGYNGKESFTYPIIQVAAQPQTTTPGPLLTNLGIGTAGVLVVGQILNALTQWAASDKAGNFKWQDAATAWTALAALRDFFNLSCYTAYTPASGQKAPTLPLVPAQAQELTDAVNWFLTGGAGTANGLFADWGSMQALIAAPDAPTCKGG